MAKIEKLVDSAREHLEQGEQVLASVMGAYETKLMGSKTVRNGVFIATDRRMVFYGKKMFGYDLEVFPYSNISSIEMSKGMMGHSIGFFASGNKIEMKWINSGDVSEFTQIVKSKIGKKSEPAQTTSQNNSVDLADQIRKLADLRDQGILTEEEFQAKKSQLLSL